MKKYVPYNPLEKRNLAESAVNALLQQEVHPLPPEMFEGAGIYAIYYSGDFPAYAPIAQANSEALVAPIYVGKADPKGGRQGGDWDAPPGDALRSRLQTHSRSIRQSQNLELEHFRCRFLVLEDAWIRLAERMMIYWYRPLWNIEIDGFGNNKPGAGRDKQRTSAWDTLHPGRSSAAGLPPSHESLEQITARVNAFLATPTEQRSTAAIDEG